MPVDIIIIDDQLDNCQYLERIFRNFRIKSFTDPLECLRYCRQNPFDLLIADQKMPSLCGIDLIRTLKSEKDDFIALIISAFTDSDDLIDAINSNIIHKFILKPFMPDQLLIAANRSLETLRLQRRNRELELLLQEENKALFEFYRNSAKDNDGAPALIGSDPKMRTINKEIEAYGKTGQPVLITGETGTGKELAARLIHRYSSRKEGPFIAVNCSAVSETLWESEFFGHEKGAFSGAVKDKSGFFAGADGGTLFLDEVGDLPQSMQAKLLRVIQFGSYRQVGGDIEKISDIRLVCATNRELSKMIENGKFRSDLYYRISSLHLAMPPLRGRSRDIPVLFSSIVQKRGLEVPPLSAEAEHFLFCYDFPGNVRELENIIWRLHLQAEIYQPEEISLEFLRKIIGLNTLNDSKAANDIESDSLARILEKTEFEAISRELSNSDGNISQTARNLGLSRQGLKNKLRRHGLYNERMDDDRE